MIHASTIAESIVAPTLFRPAFLHSLDPEGTSKWARLTEGRATAVRQKGDMVPHSTYFARVEQLVIPIEQPLAEIGCRW